MQPKSYYCYILSEPTIALTVSVTKVVEDPNNKIALAGNVSSLGLWGEGKCPIGKSSESDKNTWKIRADVPLKPELLFKLVEVDENGKVVLWESDGNNRVISTDKNNIFVSAVWGQIDNQNSEYISLQLNLSVTQLSSVEKGFRHFRISLCYST